MRYTELTNFSNDLVMSVADEIIDTIFDIRELTPFKRLLITNPFLEGIQLEYCIPFRFFKNVYLAAVLPKAPPVTVFSSTSKFADPVMPCVISGISSANRTILNKITYRIMTSSDKEINIRKVLELLVGELTVPEICYYMVHLQALSNDAWKIAYPEVAAFEQTRNRSLLLGA